ncbi:unnamed protein product [Adineta ricciae]|uniref:G-protein coupled receptors family 3 profile domain-containing protein n=1 Tax=Adineta ricciae TaxID=249248 RepID=A0A815PCG2_ADIRI|nr:unnamed protein product [Adineta ricciae]
MNEISMDTSLFNSSIIQSQDLYFENYDYHVQLINNQTFSFISFHNPWIFPLFILSVLGILITIIILFIFLCISIRHLNHHLVLTNIFICFSVCFIYLIVIFFLLRGNEVLCSLREFLSQLAYALLYSALLCRYIMQWLAARILSSRTKQMTALMIYLLLVLVQIPIGILWWYFTSPRACPRQIIEEYPTVKFSVRKYLLSRSKIKSCSLQCIVDYRFYGTYTYAIVELSLCTIIAICLFLCRHCHRNEIHKEQSSRKYKSKTSLTCFNMFAFVLIDITWLLWTFMYHSTHPSFAFPILIVGMFTIATICLFFMLIPQIYFYSKANLNDISITQTTLFSNKLASIEEAKDDESLLQDKSNDRIDTNKLQTLSNESETSYELGTSGTFLPITRTPRGPFKVRNAEKISPTEIVDVPAEKRPLDAIYTSNNQNDPIQNDMMINAPIYQPEHRLKVPSISLHRQSTSSSASSMLLNPSIRSDYFTRYHANLHPPSTSSIYYSSYVPSHPDESIIPILCSSQNYQTTPVKMRILVKSPPLSVPKAHRVRSGADHRYARYPYPHRHPSRLPLPPATPSFYSSAAQPQQQQYYAVDPYRVASPSYSNSYGCYSNTPPSNRYPYTYRRYPADHRSLAQRLWDIDSGDDEDEIAVHREHRYSRATPTYERLKDFRLSQTENDDQTILPIDADEEEEESYNKKRLMYK